MTEYEAVFPEVSSGLRSNRSLMCYNQVSSFKCATYTKTTNQIKYIKYLFVQNAYVGKKE